MRKLIKEIFLHKTCELKHNQSLQFLFLIPNLYCRELKVKIRKDNIKKPNLNIRTKHKELIELEWDAIDDDSSDTDSVSNTRSYYARNLKN